MRLFRHATPTLRGARYCGRALIQSMELGDELVTAGRAKMTVLLAHEGELGGGTGLAEVYTERATRLDQP